MCVLGLRDEYKGEGRDEEESGGTCNKDGVTVGFY